MARSWGLGLLVPEGEVGLAPAPPSERVPLPSHVGFDLDSKLIWDTAARPLHPPAEEANHSNQSQS